jgi:hypothetical protein
MRLPSQHPSQAPSPTMASDMTEMLGMSSMPEITS